MKKKQISSLYLFNICKNLTTVTLNKLPVNIFVIYVIIQYNFSLQVNISKVKSTPDMDQPKRVNHLTLPFAILNISGMFIENEGRFWINLTISTDQLKFNYVLWTSSHTCWYAKGLSSYSGTGILQFIFKMSYFISIDIS